MTRSSRFIFTLFAALLALATMPAHGQSNATVSFTDPNCASWAMSQNGSTFTLTCQSLSCTVTADKPSPLPTDNVVLTANCPGASSYAWTKFSGPAGCPAPSTGAVTSSLVAPGAQQLGCVYRVNASDPTNGAGSANITLNFTTTPPATPTGCAVAFTQGSASLPQAGGAITMVGSCTGNVNGSTTYAWTKSGAAFTSGATASDTLAANAGTTAITWTYAFTATNAGASPATVTQVVTVAGSGGSSGFDMSACTAAGYTGRGLDVAYPVTSGVLIPFVAAQAAIPNGTFGNSDALIIRFTTPAAGVNDTSKFAPTAYAPYQGVSRLYTVSTKPCEFSTMNQANGSIAYATAGGDPGININIGTCPYSANLCPVFGAYLRPSTTYYITMVNKTNFVPNGVASCPAGSCDMRLEFNP